MGWHRFLFVAALALIGVLHVSGEVKQPDSPPSGSGCSTAQALNGQCNVTGHVGNGGVTLTGNETTPGTGGTPGTGSRRGSDGPPTDTCPPGTLAEVCDDEFTVTKPGDPGNPSVSISDLKNFKPKPGTDHMQPNGWMIVGLSTNFYAVVGTEVETGTLLGQPASVRFVPITWYWTYGDGKSAVRGTKGATWAAQGIQEFDPTPTSHIYRKKGTYYIDLSIQFAADYKYAGSEWTHVVGTITLPANRLKATAGDAKTVLVGRDCSENSAGPGC